MPSVNPLSAERLKTRLILSAFIVNSQRLLRRKKVKYILNLKPKRYGFLRNHSTYKINSILGGPNSLVASLTQTINTSHKEYNVKYSKYNLLNWVLYDKEFWLYKCCALIVYLYTLCLHNLGDSICTCGYLSESYTVLMDRDAFKILSE